MGAARLATDVSAIKVSEIKCKINSSDIDDHGHLNNAAYPLYFEKGRENLAAINGVNRDALNPKGLAFLVKRASYEYNAPVFRDQEVDVKSRVVSFKRARVFVEQDMLYDGKVVSNCAVEYFFMDLGIGKPIRRPSSVFQKIDD